MYSILEYRQKNSNYELVDIRHSNKPRTRGPHLACRACHSMKVKCSGQRDGCSRCKARSIPCTYPKSKRTTRKSEAPIRSTTPSIGSSQSSGSHGTTPPLPDLSTLAENRLDDEWQNMSSWLLDAWTEANVRVGLTPERTPREENLQERRVSVKAGNPQVASAEATALAPLDKTRNAVMGWNSPWSPFGESRADLAGMAGSRDHPQPNDPQNIHHIPDYDLSSMLSVSDLLHLQNDHPICSTDAQRVPSVMTVDSTDTSSNGHELESQQVPSPQAPRSCSCSCVNQAFQALGDLQVIETTFPPTGFDNHLNFMKRSLDRCFDLMDCLDCVRSTAVMTLLIAICERLVISFEAWGQRYQERSTMKPGKNPDGQDTQQSLRTFFGAYEINLGDEHCSILRALAMVQLRRLNGLLGRMSDVAALQGWTDRRAVLEFFLSRAERAASTLIGRF